MRGIGGRSDKVLDSTDKIPLFRDVPAVHSAGQHAPGLTRKLRLICPGTAEPAVQRRQLRIGGVVRVNVTDMTGEIELPTAGRAPDANDGVLVRRISGKLRFVGLRIRAAHAAAAKDIFTHPQKKVRALDKTMHRLFLFRRQALRKGGGAGGRGGRGESHHDHGHRAQADCRGI